MKFKELISILIVVIVLGFSASFAHLTLTNFLYASLLFAIIFLVWVSAKKAVAYYLQTEAEVKIWSFQRYGYFERSYLKNAIPMGVILPFVLSILSFGYVTWMAVMQTEVTATRARVAKRHSIYRFSEITDWDLGWICAAGIIACLALAIVAYLFNIPMLGKLAVIFAAFNMIPFGKLDGTKIFFANTIVLWSILAVLCLIGLGFVLFLV